MLTIDEKIKIVEEKIANLKKSIAITSVPEEPGDHKNQVLSFILKQINAKKYFNTILEGLKNGIDPV
jgi:hypothetical protein